MPDEDALAHLQERCNYSSRFSAGTSAILTRIPAEYVGKGRRVNTRCLTVKLEHAAGVNKPIFVTCLHLDHRIESRRMREVENVAENLTNIFQKNEAQIWAGDFNCLTREDYTDKEWDILTRVRQNNGWEQPQTEVSSSHSIKLILGIHFHTSSHNVSYGAQVIHQLIIQLNDIDTYIQFYFGIIDIYFSKLRKA